MEIEGFTNYLIYEDGRVFNKSRNTFMKITKRTKGNTFRVTLRNGLTVERLSLEKLIGKHYPPKGGTIIQGFNNYEILDDGRVWSKIRLRFMKTHINSNGYETLKMVRNDGKQTIQKIHRLLAKTFIPNPDNLPSVDHMDRNRTNNSLNNLRWVSARDNACNQTIAINNTSGYSGIKITIYNTFEVIYSDKNHLQKSKTFKTKKEAINFREEMVRLYYNRPE